MARVMMKLGLLLAWVLTLISCASNEVLFAEYDENFCAIDESVGVPVIIEKVIEKEVFRDKLVVNEVPAVSKQLPWEPAIYFDSDATSLNEASLQTLDNNVRFLKKFPHYNISIRGFTDQHASVEYNRKLSGKRTSRVVEYFTGAGVDEKRLKLHAHGESIALNEADSPVADEISRRVEMILLDIYGRPAVTFQNVAGRNGG